MFNTYGGELLLEYENSTPKIVNLTYKNVPDWKQVDKMAPGLHDLTVVYYDEENDRLLETTLKITILSPETTEAVTAE